MTDNITYLQLQRQLIQAFALIDEWFDFIDDTDGHVSLKENAMLKLQQLKSRLDDLKELDKDHLEREVTPDSHRDLRSGYDRHSASAIHPLSANGESIRAALRDDLYHFLLISELDPALGSTVEQRETKSTLRVEQLLENVVAEVNANLFELTLIKSAASV